ncbi:hypothetical protein ECW26_44850 [Escherichia coli W26]|nr:hypothetical protein ECW26_44850 [Escherichia coli W26]
MVYMAFYAITKFGVWIISVFFHDGALFIVLAVSQSVF